MEIESKKRDTRSFNGKDYVLEEGISCDYSLVKAWKGDKSGNLVFRSTAQNFNPDAAKAGKVCIAEVEELVEVGELKPDEIHLPGIYVQRIIQGKDYEKRIEKLTLTKPTRYSMSSIPSLTFIVVFSHIVFLSQLRILMSLLLPSLTLQ